MPEYKNSKIYAIKSSQANKYYLGATTKRLCQRMAQHKQNYNKYVQQKIGDFDSSFEVLQFTDAQIQLLESFECNTKDELNAKLNKYMETYKDSTVNKPKEKKVKIVKKKVVKEVEEPIKEIPQPTNTPVVESDSEYETSEEKPEEIPIVIPPVPVFMNRLQYLRNASLKL